MRNAIVALLFAVAAVAGQPKIGPYIYAVDGDQRIIHSSGNWERIESMLGRWKGSYFWIRHQGREYLIRDEATLRRIAALFAPMHAVGRELEAVHRKLRPIEQRERDIERRMDQIEDDLEEGRGSEADRARFRELKAELREVQTQIRPLEAEESRIDDRHEAAEVEAEKKLLPVVEQAIRSGAAKPL